jgi:hypothetical protein
MVAGYHTNHISISAKGAHQQTEAFMAYLGDTDMYQPMMGMVRNHNLLFFFERYNLLLIGDKQLPIQQRHCWVFP